jgi:tubulin polyglutamylase TTLL6/13
MQKEEISDKTALRQKSVHKPSK